MLRAAVRNRQHGVTCSWLSREVGSALRADPQAPEAHRQSGTKAVLAVNRRPEVDGASAHGSPGERIWARIAARRFPRDARSGVSAWRTLPPRRTWRR